jgi:hypothetical protein
MKSTSCSRIVRTESWASSRSGGSSCGASMAGECSGLPFLRGPEIVGVFSGGGGFVRGLYMPDWKRLWHDPSRGRTTHSRYAPNDPDILSTFMAKPCPPRTGNTTRCALGESGPKLFQSGEHRNPATGHGITQMIIPCSRNILHRGLGRHPFEDWSDGQAIGARLQLLVTCYSLSVGERTE